MKKRRYVEEIRIATFSYRRVVVTYEPQATAVELAQLGEGCRGQLSPAKTEQ